MRNIVGPVPRGNDFYQREDVLKRLYRRLENAGHLYMAAPRRMGKTAIMRYLEDNKTDNYYALYVITDSVQDSEQFFKTVLDGLLKSNALGQFKTLSKNVGNFVDRFIGRFKKVNAYGFGLELNDASSSYYQELQNLLRDLRDEETNFKLIIMIDEFPQAVANILREHGETEAIQFLQKNRELRQQANDTILFLLTGSIGLPALVSKLDMTQTINDLNVFEIPPLNHEDAKDLLGQLLTNKNVPYQDSNLDTVLIKLEWFSPYHIQLLAQEFIDQYDINQTAINESSIELAFQNITNRNHNINFEHYFSRLKRSFEESELHFAQALLKILCQQNKLSSDEIEALANNYPLINFGFVLRALESDGYIFKNEDGWRFTSPILKRWWHQYVCY
ncbi:MAG: hypothetical protein RIQ94_1268 [Pseudomonadota bacterium]|jgi:hypothetical protein